MVGNILANKFQTLTTFDKLLTLFGHTSGKNQPSLIIFEKLWSLERRRSAYILEVSKILQKEYILPTVGFDTAENEPSRFIFLPLLIPRISEYKCYTWLVSWGSILASLQKLWESLHLFYPVPPPPHSCAKVRGDSSLNFAGLTSRTRGTWAAPPLAEDLGRSKRASSHESRPEITYALKISDFCEIFGLSRNVSDLYLWLRLIGWSKSRERNTIK